EMTFKRGASDADILALKTSIRQSLPPNTKHWRLDQRSQAETPTHPATFNLTIIPTWVNKAKAVEHLIDQGRIKPDRLVVAGDGRNDIEILSVNDGRFSVVVGKDEGQNNRSNSSLRSAIRGAKPKQ